MSREIFESSSNSNGNSDVTPPSRGRCRDNGRDDGFKSWERFYNSCPLWGSPFCETQDPDAEWPRGLRWEMGRMFFREKFCIPSCLQKSFIRKTHACLGHVGGKLLWEHMSLTTEWAQEDEAHRLTMCISRQCETCQACVKPPGFALIFLIPPLQPGSWSV